ncbi:hypothetical protein CBS76997_9691 [Aspergillus niger]|nr:hypothetical protein CBS11852_11478 [Aspergillus niger]KAI3014415.1 hypothetical protein CBS147347_11490 [Aspergillus niger]KAI3036791.1 hypothetical protein CBS76997_9691 [Aspergillus niger]KAI3050044.1 hypothetical protein CBS147353_11653 [Aspergillus niger]
MQKNTLTGVVPPAEMKGSRAPSRKMKTYPRSCVIRARFYRALEKAQHESQRLEQALWSQNHAGSIRRTIMRVWNVVGKQRLFLGAIVIILGTSVSVVGAIDFRGPLG